MERVSVSTLGEQATGDGGVYENVSLSADGRYVAFSSDQSDLVPDDTNLSTDVFVRDRVADTTERVSLHTVGNETPSGGYADPPPMTPDGRFVVFRSGDAMLDLDHSGDPAMQYHVYVRDRGEGPVPPSTTLISRGRNGEPANDGAGYNSLAISDDGRYVAFDSYATNLVGSADTNQSLDLFVFDRTTEVTRRVSVSSAGIEADNESGPVELAVNGDGHPLAFFQTHANNLVSSDPGPGLFVRDVTDRTTERVVPASFGNPILGDVSADGSRLVYSRAIGNLLQTYVLERTSGDTEMVSVNSSGVAGNDSSFRGSMSADGRYVVFTSEASNLVGVSVGNFCDEGSGPKPCYNAFLRDRLTGSTTWLSVNDLGVGGDYRTYNPDISADGEVVAFMSNSSNLVPNDTNGLADAFARPRAEAPSTATGVAPGTVTTGPDTTIVEPMAAAVVSAQAGSITITAEAGGQSLDGFDLFGYRVDISAPLATPEEPLELTFWIDASLIPPGTAAADVVIFRTEAAGSPTAVGDCTGSNPIVPDPCVALRTLQSDGDVRLVVRTSSASIWDFGITSGQPDGRIRVGTSGTYTGNNVYNTTAVGQSKTASAPQGSSVTFSLSIQNDGEVDDRFLVLAAGSTSSYVVKYLLGTTDVTAAVVAGTYQTPTLAPGGTHLLTAKVKVTTSATAGSKVTRKVTITSVNDHGAKDAVKFIVMRS